jgi:dephospho-CoA kinase
VRRIAIAGGIGAGKSVVTDRLASLGWPVVDADLIAREVVEPGRPAWRALRDAFGDAVLASDGSIDRGFVADVVFHDPTALRRLNQITHGPIGVEMLRQMDAASGRAVFLALPLFRPEHRDALRLDEVWAVLAPPDTANARLVDQRGFTDEQARARLAAQMDNEERARVVDRVLWNDGTIEELYAALDALLAEAGLGGR